MIRLLQQLQPDVIFQRAPDLLDAIQLRAVWRHIQRQEVLYQVTPHTSSDMRTGIVHDQIWLAARIAQTTFDLLQVHEEIDLIGGLGQLDAMTILQAVPNAADHGGRVPDLVPGHLDESVSVAPSPTNQQPVVHGAFILIDQVGTTVHDPSELQRELLPLGRQPILLRQCLSIDGLCRSVSDVVMLVELEQRKYADSNIKLLLDQQKTLPQRLACPCLQSFLVQQEDCHFWSEDLKLALSRTSIDEFTQVFAT